jgi:hypothetical protein
MNRMWVIVLMCCAVLAGCAKQPAEVPAEIQEPEVVVEWLETSPEMMTETQRAQQELVASATNAMVSEWMGELMAALDSGDPSNAIGVCKDKAPEVASHVSAQYGLDIGRTSHKLRNPANVAPEWADEYVDDLVDTPVYLVGPEGELGVLLPIKLKAECQMCHGPTEAIDEDIMAEISENYPEDQAVGFAEGDLRGWMWIEAPPGDAAPAETM